MEATYNEVRKILSKNFFINPRAISEAKKFKNDLGLNSVEFLEMVYDIESTFGINIPDEQLEKVRTVKDMARCVEMQRVAVLV
jgi:acyl carrier protein